MDYILYTILFLLFNLAIYDKFIQRKHQLLINYPVIGRMRYVFEALREPFRQYFGNEDFYESKDKIDWVYDNAYGKTSYSSFSPNQVQPNPKFLIKHANVVLNDDEVDIDFQVIFGEKREQPYTTKTVVGRSAMSDGSISPEGTRAFAKASYDGNFPINTGEGSLTSNFFITHKPTNDKYMTTYKIEGSDVKIYKFIKAIFNNHSAINYFKKKLIVNEDPETFMFDFDNLIFFRPNWDAPFEDFPKTVPEDLPEIIFQMSSGLYGVRDKKGNFDEDKYKKTLAFCKMTEIKIAQGAKQTGGKLIAEKVTSAVAYYRGVEEHKDVFSPNRFPYANNISELFDFVAKLQKLSEKPVGIKVVISSKHGFEEIVKEIKRRKDENIDGIPDFITIDGGDGGSATALLFLMERVGFHVKDALHIADNLLTTYGVRDEIKLVASSKILTPDDVIIALSLGADFVQIARGFMLSAGCIRARMCSGEGSHNCPVGLATQNEKLRKSYLVYKQSQKIANYHAGLLRGMKTILAVMGKKSVNELESNDLTFIDKNGFIHADVNRFFEKKITN